MLGAIGAWAANSHYNSDCNQGINCHYFDENNNEICNRRHISNESNVTYCECNNYMDANNDGICDHYNYNAITNQSTNTNRHYRKGHRNNHYGNHHSCLNKYR